MKWLIKNKIIIIKATVFIIALVFVLVINGAVPFLSTPSLGIVVWATGFSQSFANSSIFSIFAQNFGAPHPAAIAFGLAGAWPTAVFIKFGLFPADAYTLTVAFWLTISFVSAYKIARYFSVSTLLSILGAVAWLTMPIIYAHSGYAMLSIGIALIPLYFLAPLYLFLPKTKTDKLNKLNIAKKAAIYLVVCLISVFMDGYSFMMFVVGSSIIGVWLFIKNKDNRKKFLKFYFPIHFLSLVTAYLFYSIYIGKIQFDSAPIDMFRSLGADLMYLFIPSKGNFCFFDFFNLSVTRSGSTLFGDASVWTTTFSMPIILGSIWAFVKGYPKKIITVGFLLIALFGFYMALGPSLKINSIRPAEEKNSYMMSEKYALIPTGSALISEYLPGFKNMRGSYRWVALGVFGAWVVLILAMSSDNKKRIIISTAVIVGVIAVLNMPHLSQKLNSDINNRKMFFKIDYDLVRDMKGVLLPNEKVAFLPWGNDFLVNYVASRSNIITYNTGGDKNLAKARQYWPKTMSQFPSEIIDDGFANRILLLLARNEADSVILPYINMRWASYYWPYPADFKDELKLPISQLQRSGFVDIENREYYSVIRLKPEFINLAKREIFDLKIMNDLKIDCSGNNIEKSTNFFKKNEEVGFISCAEGLSFQETWGTWSDGDDVVLEFSKPLPVKFTVRLTAHAFGPNIGASFIASIGNNSIQFSLSDLKEEKIIKFDNPQGLNTLKIRVPYPASPQNLGVGNDGRKLGIAFSELNITAN